MSEFKTISLELSNRVARLRLNSPPQNVITSPHARWGFPEIKLGCFPPVACAGLAAVVGPKHAADLIFTGRQIDGTEAEAIGLANEALGSCAEHAEEFAGTLADLSPAAL